MGNYTKIYPSTIHRLVDWRSLISWAKTTFSMVLPLGKPLAFAVLTVGLLLVLQVFLVGVFDRFGISPKISLIVSSLFYATVFAGMAVVGGMKRFEIGINLPATTNAQLICKILIIKSNKPEI